MNLPDIYTRGCRRKVGNESTRVLEISRELKKKNRSIYVKFEHLGADERWGMRVRAILKFHAG